jgi:hypothetical protein
MIVGSLATDGELVGTDNFSTGHQKCKRLSRLEGSSAGLKCSNLADIFAIEGGSNIELSDQGLAHHACDKGNS